MRPSLAYTGTHERDTINPEGITYRFIVLLGEADFDREEFSSLPNQAGMIAKPFSAEASIILANNPAVQDVILED